MRLQNFSAMSDQTPTSKLSDFSDKKIYRIAAAAYPNTIHLREWMTDNLVNCGFNLGIFSSSPTAITSALKVSKPEGFDLIVSHPNLWADKEKCIAFMDSILDNSEIAKPFGWGFQDQLLLTDLEKLKTLYHVILNYNHSENPKRVFLNLAGLSQEDTTDDDVKAYENYLNDIQENFDPIVWSYDLYPIIQNPCDISVELKDFYNNLEIFHKRSQESGRPFWTHIQSQALIHNTGRELPIPKEEYMRFEVFSSLAYGAKGLVWWRYCQQDNLSNETYMAALADRDGNPTPLWYLAQKINREVEKFEKLFGEGEICDIRHFKTEGLGNVTQLTLPYGPIKNIDCNGGTGFMISKLEYNDQRYFIIVSHDIQSTQKIEFELLYNLAIVDCTEDLYAQESITTSNLSFTRILYPGGYLILKY